jgi:hypothetical protein
MASHPGSSEVLVAQAPLGVAPQCVGPAGLEASFIGVPPFVDLRRQLVEKYGLCLVKRSFKCLLYLLALVVLSSITKRGTL